MGKLNLWSSVQQPPERVQIERMAWVGAKGVQDPEGPVPADSLVIHTVDPPGDSAAVLVPDASASGAKVNGIAVEPGLHLVHHGDCLEVAGRRFWVELQLVAA